MRFGGYAGEKVDVRTIKAGQSDVFVRTNITGERGRSQSIGSVASTTGTKLSTSSSRV